MDTRAARALAIAVLPLLLLVTASGQQADTATIVRALNTQNQSRFDNLLSFSDVEHYAVFRGKDQVHPAAEMTVKMTYDKRTGKSYSILSESGSEIIMKYGLHPLLENEKAINHPSRVAQSWFTSANYDMRLKDGPARTINGRSCVAVDITPRRKAPNMIDGNLWIDARDHTLVQVEGVASQKPSVFAGTTHMMRLYANMHGYAMATHARAESSSLLFGRTVVTVDYTDYHFQFLR